MDFKRPLRKIFGGSLALFGYQQINLFAKSLILNGKSGQLSNSFAQFELIF
jgi:hypothetical protein